MVIQPQNVATMTTQVTLTKGIDRREQTVTLTVPDFSFVTLQRVIRQQYPGWRILESF